MSNTTLQGSYVAPTATGLTQTVTRSGSNTTALSPIALTTHENFGRVYTLTLVIDSTAPTTISFDSSTPNGYAFTRVNDTTFTVTSEAINAQGIKVNNWAYFKLFLRTIRVITTGAIWANPAFNISASISDGTTNLTGTMAVNSFVAATPSTPSVSLTRNWNTSILVDWTDSTQAYGPGIAGYYVYKDGNTTTPYATVTSGSSYVDTAVVNTSGYTYQVKAFDASTAPVMSGLSSVATALAATNPTTPTSLVIRPYNSGNSISWVASTQSVGPGVAGYYVYRDGTSSIYATVYTPNYIDYAVSPTGTYTYQIQAFDGCTVPLLSGISTGSTSYTVVSGQTQALTAPMAMNGNTLTTLGGSNIVINDPMESGNTYRVTITPIDTVNSSGTSNMKVSYDGNAWSDPLVLTGTQSSINTQLASTGFYDGLNFHQYNPDFYGTTSVIYTQEVLTTTDTVLAAPYVQATGTLTFNTTYTAPFTIGSNPGYTEDTTLTFSAGQISDLAGYYYPGETCGLYSGYNCYTVTITATGTYPGTNPIIVTVAGDPAPNHTVSVTGNRTDLNSLLNNIQIIPPADWTDPIPLSVTVTRGNTPVTIYTGTMTATCGTTHSEFSIIGGANFAIGENTINFGAITDLAVDKNYTVTIDAAQDSALYGTLTDMSGVGTWNSTGGTLGYGRLTISGTKAVVNTSLSAIKYTTGPSSAITDSPTFNYTQTQTTNSLSQGTATTILSATYAWGAGNYSGSFVYDENTKMTYDLGSILATITGTAKAQITLSTSFSTANGGSITGWTKISDTVWEFSGTKAAVNAALAATEFVPPADLIASFVVDIKIYDDAVVEYDSAASLQGETFVVRTTYAKYTPVASFNLLFGDNTMSAAISSITDVRPENISSAITYSVTLTTSNTGEITSMSSAGSGGSSLWVSPTLTITGTKTQVNSHLANLTINYVGTIDSTLTYTQTQTTNSVSQGTQVINVIRILPQFLVTGTTTTARTSDFDSWIYNSLSEDSNNTTILGNKWMLNFAPVSNTSTISAYKSTSTNWQAITIPTAFALPLFEDLGPIQSVVTNGMRVVMIYDGLAGGGANDVSISSSTNDTTWNTSILLSAEPTNGINGGAFISGNNNRLHIIFRDRDDAVRMATSTNATSWSFVTLATGTASNPTINIRIKYNNGKYICPAVVSGNKIFVSTDGTSWTTTSISHVPLTSSAYANSIWAVMSNNTADGILYTEKYNGTTWTSSSTGLTTLAPEIVGNDSIFVMRNGGKLYSSTDAVTWTERSLGFTYSYPTSAAGKIAFMNSKFYCIAAESSIQKIYSSTDGISWTLEYTFGAGTNYTSIAYSA